MMESQKVQKKEPMTVQLGFDEGELGFPLVWTVGPVMGPSVGTRDGTLVGEVLGFDDGWLA
jgi:hypothetical protein